MAARVCATEGCATLLSKYNRSRYCFACENPRAIRPRDLRLSDDPVGDEWAEMWERGRFLDDHELRTFPPGM